MVKKFASLWMDHANISFNFVDGGAGQVRIAFTEAKGSWSAVGTDALCDKYFSSYLPTLNFGWLLPETSEADCKQVILHEFGHVLGCCHEHQSPAAPFTWNEEEVYNVFGGSPNFWPPEKVRHNVLNKLSLNDTVYSEYDPDSIMLYEFDGGLFQSGVGTKWNGELSDGDKAMIKKLYPFN